MTADTPFLKVRTGAGADYYQAEAAGLRWLAASGTCSVPVVRSVSAANLVIDRVPVGASTPAAGRRFGAQLARLHQAGAPAFGSAPPDAPERGWIADLPMNYGDFTTFGPMYAQLRVLPYVRLARAAGQLSGPDCGPFEELAEALADDEPGLVGPPEAASRLHGDLWSGNLIWAADRIGQPTAWLIDPAAHGGHRETDLAMLALFGAPQLAEIMAGYQAEAPLSEGWQARRGLHQVYPLLVHTVLFGGGYAASARSAAVRALRALH
ncbi:MAG: hypothetical protein QG671_1443 [Actinomycetota bacterium]|nr:hypothetical protein [Actinomycetota bacterium]